MVSQSFSLRRYSGSQSRSRVYQEMPVELWMWQGPSHCPSSSSSSLLIRVADRRTVEKKEQSNALKGSSDLCTMADVQETHKEMSNFGSNAFIREVSLHAKIFLLALSQCVKRAGVPEVELEKVRIHILQSSTRKRGLTCRKCSRS